jgi:hypothetical protein
MTMMMMIIVCLFARAPCEYEHVWQNIAAWWWWWWWQGRW